MRHFPRLILIVLAGTVTLHAQQKWEYGGFFEVTGQFYTRRPNPADTYAIGTARFQFWSRATINDRLSWRGTYDSRLDTHRDVERGNWFDVSQRGLRQPAGTPTEFYFDFKLGRLDLRAGNQQIRWGRADGFNPTDNLIPYDYLDTFAGERLSVTALKADVYAGNSRFEAAWIPFFTPTRLPLIGQRWFPRLPHPEPAGVSLEYTDGSRALPARTFGNSQWAARWNQFVPGAEFSFSYFDGFDDLPFFSIGTIQVIPPALVLVPLNRRYYRTRVAGMDFASQLGPFGARGEAAYFDVTDPNNLDHAVFVLGLDRTWGDWSVIIQYAGRHVSGAVSETAVFPELALRSTLLYRVEKTLGPSRSFEVKGAVRLRDGDLLIQPLYNVAVTNNWRLELGAAIFAGPKDTYFGQFRDNTNLTLQLRYSF